MKKEFRILAHEHEGKTKLQVHEVLYAGDSPVAYETEPFFISGGSILDLLHLINEISECYEKPILWGGKKFPAVHITQLCDICGSSNIIEAPHMGMNCNDCHPL